MTGNVTVDEIRHWLATGDGPDEGHPGWTRRLGETARRGLEMCESLKAINEWLVKNEMPSLEEMDELRETLRVIATRFDGPTDAKSMFDAGASPDESDWGEGRNR